MFIGHFGVGLAAKKAAPRVSLGVLFISVQFLDLLWPNLLLLGWERVEIQPGMTRMTPLNFTYYPWSHSLVMALAWGLLIGALYFLFRRDRSGALVVGLSVFSHWILDLLVHIADLPLAPGMDHFVGLGLWNHEAIEVILEGLIFFTGVYLYLKNTRSKNRTGNYAFWGLILFLLAVHMANLLGPVPPNVMAIAWGAQLQWIFVIWAFWVDKNRQPAN